ncbi:MAG TPA: hypothetical protein VFI39_05785 [Gemmatimonadales bacterium]|nr:hypothetical protein [Gemmatimonadales bacterium]
MSSSNPAQGIVEQFILGHLSQRQAVDALIAVMQQHKASGGEPGSIAVKKPVGMTLSAEDHARLDALMQAVDQRLSGA